ncbi:MAG: hypothetical protein FWE09_07810 [Treponema sp.]|nr:hypothetical protein [Treponema sp.]
MTKRFSFGALAVALALAFALNGCAGAPRAAATAYVAPVFTIEGSWYQTQGWVEMGILFENGVWSMTYNDFYSSRGTYEIQNGAVTMYVTHVWEDLGDGPEWLDRDDLRAFLLDEGFTPEQADAELDIIFDPETANYSVTALSLTFYGEWDDGETWEAVWQRR